MIHSPYSTYGHIGGITGYNDPGAVLFGNTNYGNIFSLTCYRGSVYGLNDGWLMYNYGAGIVSPLGSGSGTLNNPYQIHTVEDLQYIPMYDGNNVYFKLINDIDLQSNTWTPIPDFYGHLIGNSKTISNFNLYASPYETCGLFAQNHGTIEYLNLEGSGYASGFSTIGLLIGTNYGTLQSTQITGYMYVYGDYCYVGLNAGINCGTINNSGSFRGNSPNSYMIYNPTCTGAYTGGIVGYNDRYAAINSCANLGDIYSVAYNRGQLAGLNYGIATGYNLGSLLP